ncbi:MAG: copper resistance protein NlpE N-terminal domain-containing protein [Burkholderiales bacterium]|nr:copper resistance protein NlpE N-terminal domain-containing protein [Burkholderiales bacterium]
MHGERPRRSGRAAFAVVVLAAAVASCATGLAPRGADSAAGPERGVREPAPDGAAADADAPGSAPRVDPAAAATAYAGARTYAGTLSCAGCAERSLALTILADGTFRLRQAEAVATGQGQGDIREGDAREGNAGEPRRPVSYEFGRWTASPQAADVLELHGNGGASWLLRRVAPDALLLLDNEGREIRGLEGAALARAARIEPLSGPFRLVGRYRYEEGRRPVFMECLTGQRLPVVPGVPQDGTPRSARMLAHAQAALDGALAAMSQEPGEAVLAVVRGYLVPRQAQAASPERESLVVAGFERAMRDGRCEDAMRSLR